MSVICMLLVVDMVTGTYCFKNNYLKGNKMKRTIGILLLCCCISLPSVAKNKDSKGSADHPLISRYPGSIIMTYTSKDYDEYLLPLGPRTKKNQEVGFKKKKAIEGKVTRIGYKIKNDTSVLKIFRNFESALKKSGFNTLFSCEKESCGKESWKIGRAHV